MILKSQQIHAVVVLALLVMVSKSALAETSNGEAFTNYFRNETAKISGACLANIHSLADWEAARPELRREAQEMLGLDPMPKRAELKPVITGKIEEKDFTVEKLYFQSLPHLYVTADLYLPKPLTNPAPAILYLCGHLPVITNGVSYGNKTAYQHHGIWFARNGYVCLVVDTLQYGEILGHHRGTYDEGAWWWNSRGYTPAGVETWNAMRALDYLDSRPEVDTNRIGVTGRSGGGAYSWFLTAIDDRVKVAAPVAGITDLKDYCAEGAVDEHCDCMFLVNTYRWDYPMLAALCAPRPLMLANTDSDEFFALDGVMHTHDLVKRIYDLYGASTNFGLVLAPGPHKDIQDLQVPVFHWFNIYLKHEDPPIAMPAVKMFRPEELKVFSSIPKDQINTNIEESFEPEAQIPPIPATSEDWENLKKKWMQGLRKKCFAGWPKDAERPQIMLTFSAEEDGIQYEVYRVESEHDVFLNIYLMRKAGEKPQQIFLRITNSVSNLPGMLNTYQYIGKIADAFGTAEALKELKDKITSQGAGYAVFTPRSLQEGTGLNDTQLRRRFMLIGQTLDGMQVWDIFRMIYALHSINNASLTVEASDRMAVNTLYASLFVRGISTLQLDHVPASQKDGPDYLNVLKILDIPEATAMAAENCRLQLQSDQTEGWEFLRQMQASPIANVKVQWAKPKPASN